MWYNAGSGLILRECLCSYYRKGMTAWQFNKLLAQITSDDMSALEELFNEYYPKAFAIACFKLKNRSEAHDIASDVIIKLCGLRERYIRNPNAYIYTMTENRVKDFLRQPKPVYIGDFHFLENVAVEDTSVNFNFWDLLGDLSDIDKEIVYQRILLDLRFADIAQNLNLSVGTVKRHYAVSRKLLKTNFEKDCGK